MKVRQQAREIVEHLRDHGFEAFWVGGCVRDQLLGKEPVDYDIATSAKPSDIEALFPHTIPVGRKFGVVLVVRDGHSYQVATFRSDSAYADGRRPDAVAFGNARNDALRRDFTINGLFYDPATDCVHDWVGGEADLKAKVLRTIGEPLERFAEDHLRLLRAVRFAAQLGFRIEERTGRAIRGLAARINRISAERIRDELLRLFRPPHAAQGLQLLADTGLLAHVLPEVHATIDCPQPPQHHPEGSVFNHVLKMLSLLPNEASDALAWSVLLHDIGKPLTLSVDPATGDLHFYSHDRVGAEVAESVLRRLRFPKKDIEQITACVRFHMQFKDAQHMRRATLRRVLLRETLDLELELHRLDCLGSNGRLENHQFVLAESLQLKAKPQLRPPLLNGRDLLAMGMISSPELGALLNEIRDRQLQEELRTPAEARAWAAERIRLLREGSSQLETPTPAAET